MDARQTVMRPNKTKKKTITVRRLESINGSKLKRSKKLIDFMFYIHDFVYFEAGRTLFHRLGARDEIADIKIKKRLQHRCFL